MTRFGTGLQMFLQALFFIGRYWFIQTPSRYRILARQAEPCFFLLNSRNSFPSKHALKSKKGYWTFSVMPTVCGFRQYLKCRIHIAEIGS
jgi:hypothetical protein